MKNFLKPIILPILKFLVCIFFDKKYIKGKYFENSFSGYKMALRSIWTKNILRLSPPHKFPTIYGCTISNSENIYFHPDDLNNFQSPGTYYQNFNGKIYIGKGTYIAPNVGIITANHELNNLDAHTEGMDVIIGDKCWIGMNSVILPGVQLGNGTVVAAGAVVTKSFQQGNIVLAGIPAKIIKEIN